MNWDPFIFVIPSTIAYVSGYWIGKDQNKPSRSRNKYKFDCQIGRCNFHIDSNYESIVLKFAAAHEKTHCVCLGTFAKGNKHLDECPLKGIYP